MAEKMDGGGRTDWFREARFGMFVHWGCYSVLGRGEQIMARDLMPLSEVIKVQFEAPPYALTEVGPEWLDGSFG